MPRIVPLGDKAVLAEFCETLDLEVNVHIQRLAKAIHLRGLPWVRDVLGSTSPLAMASALIEECLAGELRCRRRASCRFG